MANRFDLFLSHNKADKSWTERLATAVEADRGGPPLKVFFDKWDIPHGADIPLELEQGLTDSRYVGLVLSPESLSSDWVALERSTAIYRDPAARNQRMIPLMRRTSTLPDTLARLKYIDFRRDADFDDGVATLIAILRGLPIPRGADLTEADIHFRDDAELLRQHRQIFERPAFTTPCVMELFLQELIDALDDTMAALNTGSLYSRSAKLLSEFRDSGDYSLPEFRTAFQEIRGLLQSLKRQVLDFDDFFGTISPGYTHHRNFYAMVMSTATGQPYDVAAVVRRMDDIDRTRNRIFDQLNPLLLKCHEQLFEPLTLSSTILRAQGIGGAQGVVEYLDSEPGG